jgi:integrase
MIARLTGLRLGNVVGIRMKDIDLKRRCVHFDRDVVKNDEELRLPVVDRGCGRHQEAHGVSRWA